MSRILVADDSADVRMLLVATLSRNGHAVDQAADGERAFELLTTEFFSVAVLDVMMPGIDGLTLCRMLRDTPGLGHLGIVIISASTSEVAALAAGADAFISKPFSPSSLSAIVGRLAGSTGPDSPLWDGSEIERASEQPTAAARRNADVHHSDNG